MPKRVCGKTHQAQKKRYYAKYSLHNINHLKRWKYDECLLVLLKPKSDLEIAKSLGRSLESIHVMRAHLKRKIKKENTNANP